MINSGIKNKEAASSWLEIISEHYLCGSQEKYKTKQKHKDCIGMFCTCTLSTVSASKHFWWASVTKASHPASMLHLDLIYLHFSERYSSAASPSEWSLPTLVRRVLFLTFHFWSRNYYEHSCNFISMYLVWYLCVYVHLFYHPMQQWWGGETWILELGTVNLRGSLPLHVLSQLSDLSLTQFPHLNSKGIYYSFSVCIKIPQGINASNAEQGYWHRGDCQWVLVSLPFS